jgi:hypothetical protein
VNGLEAMLVWSTNPLTYVFSVNNMQFYRAIDFVPLIPVLSLNWIQMLRAPL